MIGVAELAMAEAIVELLSAQHRHGDGEVAGYVDSECVKQTQVNGGSVSIGSFSERYGRTTPVYWQPRQDDMARDAARYRWLREGHYKQSEVFNDWCEGELDAAIDAAMKATGGEP